MRKFEETGSALDKARIKLPSGEGDTKDIVKEGVDRIAAPKNWGIASVATVKGGTNGPKSSVYRILRRKLTYCK